MADTSNDSNTPVLGEDVVLRERERLTHLLELLPSKAQLGFSGLKDKWNNRGDKGLKQIVTAAAKTNDPLVVEYTCLDVTPATIVFGSNLGIVYVYDRRTSKLSKFVCEQKQVPVTSIRLLESRMFVACGQFSGAVTLFNFSEERQGQMKVQLKCTVEAHHVSPVTCLQWTPDGMKLFTGDSEGNVAITVINMDEGKTHTVFICKEDSPIVQLAFSQVALLISTLRRSLVWPFNTKQIVQVGVQDRKVFGNFGACFYPVGGVVDENINVYAARPGLRLWRATVDGKVLSTMMFRESINKGIPEIQTIDLPSSSEMPTQQSEQKQFGTMKPFHDQFLITFQGSNVWVLDPTTGVVVGCHSNLGCVVDVGVCDNDIFVLTKERENLVRKITFEVSQCIVVEELDLNNPTDVIRAQRASSVNQFEDQDRIDKLLDEVGCKMNRAFFDVKTRVKEIKEQIISRDASEDDRGSESDRFSSPKAYFKKGATDEFCLGTSEGYSTGIYGTTDDEDFSDRPFNSSNDSLNSSCKTGDASPPKTDNSSSIDTTERIALTEEKQVFDVTLTHHIREKEPVFSHLSKEEFPQDIVFQGTSIGAVKRKKKKKRKGKDPTVAFPPDEKTFFNILEENAKKQIDIKNDQEVENSIENLNVRVPESVTSTDESKRADVNEECTENVTNEFQTTRKFDESQQKNSGAFQTDNDYLTEKEANLSTLECDITVTIKDDTDISYIKEERTVTVHEDINSIFKVFNDQEIPNGHPVVNQKLGESKIDLQEESNIDVSEKNEGVGVADTEKFALDSHCEFNVDVDQNTTSSTTRTKDVEKDEPRECVSDKDYMTNAISSLKVTDETKDNGMNVAQGSPHLEMKLQNSEIVSPILQQRRSFSSIDSDTEVKEQYPKMTAVDDNPTRNSFSLNPAEVSEMTKDMNIINVNISHKRQGSNVSIASLSERCREIRGEAIEDPLRSNYTGNHCQLENNDTLEGNLQPPNEPLSVQLHSGDESDEDGKLYPASPFPPSQARVASIYAQGSLDLSEVSLELPQELGDEDERLLEDMMEYDRIDVQNDLIESIDSITDVEDNDSEPIVEICKEDVAKSVSSSTKRKRKKKTRSSLPSSPSSSDMEGRPVTSKDGNAPESIRDRLRYLADSWAGVVLPNITGQIQILACSSQLVWLIDNMDQVYYSPAVTSQDYVWKKLEGKTMCIATNQPGSIVWCIDRNNVAYYRIGIKEQTPQGMGWEPFEKNVHHVAVDKDSVWVIKKNGDVFVRTGVSSKRPYGSTWVTIKANSDLVQITCLNGIVWALDIYNHVQIFQGDLREISVSGTADQDLSWSELPGITARHVVLGSKAVCWIIDKDGSVWFNQDVTHENPCGGNWYQLSLGDNSPSGKDNNWFSSVLSYFTHGNEPKIITANDIGGVMILGKQGSIHVAHGHLLGTRWEAATPNEGSSTSCWTCISAGGADMNKGYVWALQPNGQLSCFKSGRQSYNVHPPNRVVLKHCSAGPRSLWALTSGPEVYVRLGISDTCPQGLKWLKVDMLAQGNQRLLNISAGNHVVWAVDVDGNAWFQMGREDRRGTGYAPAWVPVEGCPLDDAKFVKIVVGPDDFIVWACDNKNNVYARKDITMNFWVGTSWEIVSGTSGIDIAISNNHVWNLCPNGDVLCRFGVYPSNVSGDYWKKVPGQFEKISVSANDELWGINRSGHLFQRETLLFYGSTLSCKAPSYEDLFSDHNDWEFI